jgi:uncharacterized protein DUF302
VYAQIDHAADAACVGLDLRPTLLLIFGNPSGGTLLMQDWQSVGIDLPVKALAREDADGAVWLTYDDPDWLAGRHGLRQASAGASPRFRTGRRLRVQRRHAGNVPTGHRASAGACCRLARSLWR